MTADSTNLHPDRRDFGVAALPALLALGCYVRTLAPDVLYSDCAEFQTLTYTLGIAHSTGYPVYLLLARLAGFLPLGSPAWRISFFSALCAAAAVGGVYLLARFVTHSRAGAALGSIALALSYTFWSQAVIAEVYTAAVAFIVVILCLLAHWQRAPYAHRRALFLATALSCLGLGVHTSVVLPAPAALVFVLVTLVVQREAQWRRCLGAAVSGFALGLGLYFLAFFLLDAHNPPSSFIRVMLLPSRAIWGLQSGDVDSFAERWWLTVSGVQWQDAMFPEDGDFIESLGHYLERLQTEEFSLWMLLCALLSLRLPSLKRRAPGVESGQGEAAPEVHRVPLGLFFVLTYAVMLAFVLNYYPGDRYIFFMLTYVFVAVAIGAGAGRLLSLVSPRRVMPGVQCKPVHYLAVPLLLLLSAMVVLPYAEVRVRALRRGVADFVWDVYPYPLEDLAEPRRIAESRLAVLPENAFVVMDWRGLYATAYVAYVEGVRPGIILKEALPHGSNGRMASTLIEEIEMALRDGRPVFAEQNYDSMRDRFRVRPASRGMYRVTLREDNESSLSTGAP